VDHEPNAARIVLELWIVEALFGRNAGVYHTHALLVYFDNYLCLCLYLYPPRFNLSTCAPSCPRCPFSGSTSSFFSFKSNHTPSVCVERTTEVSVRETPSIERILRINSSRPEVLSTFTLSSSVC